MSAHSFNPDSDDEDGGQPEASNKGESSNVSGTESEEKEDVQPPLAKEKRSASEQLVWTEMNRWHRIDSMDAENLIFIRRELKNTTAVRDYCIFRVLTRKMTMEIFNSRAVG